MKTFDYSLVKNPEYFKENCQEAHSSHKYYSSAEAMECASWQFSLKYSGFFTNE